MAGNEVLYPRSSDILEDNRELLTVGDCVRDYYRTNVRRIKKRKLQGVRFNSKARHAPGCPPSFQELREAIQKMEEETTDY